MGQREVVSGSAGGESGVRRSLGGGQRGAGLCSWVTAHSVTLGPSAAQGCEQWEGSAERPSGQGPIVPQKLGLRAERKLGRGEPGD